MKTKLFVFSLLVSLCYWSCDDTLDTIGMGIQPGEDKISVYDTVINLAGKTVKVDSIYARTTSGYLGRIYDPAYGTIKSGFICQYYPSIGFDLDDMVDQNKIDSVRVEIYYNNFLGDSLAPMQATAYPLKEGQRLINDFYTNLDASEYCDLENPFGKVAYTVRDMRLNDSISYANPYRRISIPMDNAWGYKFLDEYKKEGHGAWASLEEFLEFFPGTYIESSFGIGSMAAVDFSEIHVYYTINVDNNGVTEKSAAAAILAVTKEVIQLNRFENTHDEYLLEESDDKMYLKTPAGVFSKITIPIKKIYNGLDGKTLNRASVSIAAEPRKDKNEYAFEFPGLGVVRNTSKSKLLLIEPDSVKLFFEEQRVANAKTVYATVFNSKTYTYDFNNISNVIQRAIDTDPNKDLELLLIPVQTEFYESSSSSATVDVDYKTMHFLHPSAVTLKKGEGDLQIQIVGSDLTVNN